MEIKINGIVHNVFGATWSVFEEWAPFDFTIPPNQVDARIGDEMRVEFRGLSLIGKVTSTFNSDPEHSDEDYVYFRLDISEWCSKS